jgi:hypothetical protein
VTTTIDAAASAVITLARTIGPVLPIEPAGKRPLCAHGCKDASVDAAVILGWLRRWPDCNWAVATGAPGPDVIDLDDPRAVPDLVAQLDRLGGPCAATARGLHYYCRGTTAGTVTIEHGEVRRRGSYVCAPPSVHGTGRLYTWLVEPGVPLPDVPTGLAVTRKSVGCGDQPDVERLAPGGMHEHLTDLAVRLTRAGIVRADVIERMLICEFDAVRVPGARYAGGACDTRRIAEWAEQSEIAARERALVDAKSWWKRSPGEVN